MTSEPANAPLAGDELWLHGSGGHAKVVLSTARAVGWRVAGLVDDKTPAEGLEVAGVRVHRTPDVIPPQAKQLIAIGDARIRRRLAAELADARWLALVHPRSFVAEDAVIGDGSVVFAMAVVQPGSSVGRHAIVNTAAVVEHDNELGDYVQLATGARLTGGVSVGEGSFIGAGAVVLPGVSIGEWCTVGAGAVVTRDVEDGSVVAGVPARRMEPKR